MIVKKKTLPTIRLGIPPALTLVQETFLFLQVFFKENEPVYLFNLTPTKNSNHNTRNTDKISLFRTKYNFFKKFFFP